MKSNFNIILKFAIVILIVYLLYKFVNPIIYKLNTESFLSKEEIEIYDKVDVDSLKKGQQRMTEMFKFFDKICRDNGVKYWAIGGTLIGAIRHKGWIPWDGDIDVGMLEKDYEKFRQIVKQVLPANMVFEHRPINKPCPKIRLLDSHYIFSPFGYHWDDDDGLMLDIFIFNTNKHEIYSKLPGIDVFTSSNVDSRPYSDFFPLKELPFEDFTIYVPNKYKKMAASLWGEVPPPLLSLGERYPHEGNIVCDHVTQKMKDKYELHKKLPNKGVYTEFGRVV